MIHNIQAQINVFEKRRQTMFFLLHVFLARIMSNIFGYLSFVSDDAWGKNTLWSSYSVTSPIAERKEYLILTNKERNSDMRMRNTVFLRLTKCSYLYSTVIYPVESKMSSITDEKIPLPMRGQGKRVFSSHSLHSLCGRLCNILLVQYHSSARNILCTAQLEKTMQSCPNIIYHCHKVVVRIN